MVHVFRRHSLWVFILTIVLCIIGLLAASAISAESRLAAGSIVKCGELSAVYHLGSDNKLHPFPTRDTYGSWYKDFSPLQDVALAECQKYDLGQNVTIKPGTGLIQFPYSPKVYAVSAPNVLRHVQTEALANELFGDGALEKARIVVSEIFFGNYTLGKPISDSSEFDRKEEVTPCDTIDRCTGLKDFSLTTKERIEEEKTKNPVVVTPTPTPTPSTGNTNTSNLVTTSIPPPAPFGGNFRIACAFSHGNYDDPIVFPGQVGASHLHFFYGNASADAFSTTESLLQATRTTCPGGILNRSAYWFPAVHNADGEPVKPTFINTYYKSGHLDHRTIQPIPEGLRMISGDHRASPSAPQNKRIVHWACDSHIPNIQNQDDFSSAIPNCGPGDTLIMSISFPQCWDGVNLDSADHKSHLIHPEGTTCPSSHPVPLPEITYNIDWKIDDPSGTVGWYLASDHYPRTNNNGGYSLHGDWFMAWDKDTMATFVRHCINGGLDCNSGDLGNGTQLSAFQQGTGTIDGHGSHQHNPNPTPAPQPTPTPPPSPSPTPAPKPDPEPTPTPTPTPAPNPTPGDSITLSVDGTYATWTFPAGVGSDGATMFVFGTSPNPVYKAADTTSYARWYSGATQEDAWINAVYGSGTYYARVCEFSTITDTCTNYSNEVSVDL